MIKLEAVTKRYGQRAVVDEITLEIPKGEIVVFLGASGCGKTTTLKLINGLLPLTSGRILVGNEDVAVSDPIALRRKIGYVIQEVGLFPHFRIFDNIAVVPRLLGWDATQISRRVAELMDLVNLPRDLVARYPRELSGGQRQRVGVARALAADPGIVLMDEPFGAVDPVNRGRIQDEFRLIQQRLAKTVVLVTHDLDEALKLGDRIAVFDNGRLAQYDTPETLLARPATPFVTGFIGPDRASRLLKRTTLNSFEEAPRISFPDPIPEEAPLTEVLARLLLADGGELPVVVRDGANKTLQLSAVLDRLRVTHVPRRDDP